MWMKAEKLIKDPIFHLNLLLWMSKEQPLDNYRVNPFFFQHGYRIIYIEKPFSLPEYSHTAISSSGLDISEKPEPELILGNTQHKKALYFEAKSNAFSYGSSNCKQARAHLIACGPAFYEVMAPLQFALLCYLVPDEAIEQMSGCLYSLSQELKEKRIQPGSFSAHGLKVCDNRLEYAWDESFKKFLNIKEDSIPVMKDLEKDIDPTPLILIFSDEDCPNTKERDFYRKVVINQVRSCLLCDLHPLPIGQSYQTTAKSLLMKTTDSTFKYLVSGRQKKLERLIRENVLKSIFSFWGKKHPGIHFEREMLQITWNNKEEKQDFLDWLEDPHTEFITEKPEGEERSLFTNTF
jgi:hypothetical protein